MIRVSPLDPDSIPGLAVAFLRWATAAAAEVWTAFRRTRVVSVFSNRALTALSFKAELMNCINPLCTDYSEHAGPEDLCAACFREAAVLNLTSIVEGISSLLQRHEWQMQIQILKEQTEDACNREDEMFLSGDSESTGHVGWGLASLEFNLQNIAVSTQTLREHSFLHIESPGKEDASVQRSPEE